MSYAWNLSFLDPEVTSSRKYALIVLNQPFSLPLLQKLWKSTQWHCCADGGANRLHDVLFAELPSSADSKVPEKDPRPAYAFPCADLYVTSQTCSYSRYLPDLIKGDLDSLRSDVREYYASHVSVSLTFTAYLTLNVCGFQGVQVIHDHDQYSTDLMKCVQALTEKEQAEGCKVSIARTPHGGMQPSLTFKQYDLIILGGLSGRLDQTIHTLSYLYKLRKKRERVFTVTDENVAWILDSVSGKSGTCCACSLKRYQGDHEIHVNHAYLGKTCGLLPVGIDSTTLTTSGLEWNLSTCLPPSDFVHADAFISS